MRCSPITPSLGAEVSDVDLQTPISTSTASQLRQALNKNHVLVFRNQHLNREDHKAVARCFGELHIHPSRRHLAQDQDTEFFLIDIKPNAQQSNGETWHADITCEEVPPRASLLYLTNLPANGGGDTLFTNMHDAFNELSPELQGILRSKRAFHDGEQDLRQYGIKLKQGHTYPANDHPVIIRHPDTGQPTLYVNQSFTSHLLDTPSWESSMLLDGLFDRIRSNVRHQCRIKWTPHTLVIWDNYSVQHQAVFDYQGFARYGERLTVVGSGPPVTWDPGGEG